MGRHSQPTAALWTWMGAWPSSSPAGRNSRRATRPSCGRRSAPGRCAPCSWPTRSARRRHGWTAARSAAWTPRARSTAQRRSGPRSLGTRAASAQRSSSARGVPRRHAGCRIRASRTAAHCARTHRGGCPYTCTSTGMPRVASASAGGSRPGRRARHRTRRWRSRSSSSSPRARSVAAASSPRRRRSSFLARQPCRRRLFEGPSGGN
mmetsp:Transcript_4179/g.13369  ORF Transcript_4179/g.13369 Transcript_4179/m.13369 type:complete len:207 (+) Transcript_4179:312-932(+)